MVMANASKTLSPDVRAYLNRIGFTGLVDGSASTLAELQERHLQTVPYENLDIVRRIPLSLEIPQLFDKVVTRRRGGYCFELNALFGWLVAELGYPVTHYFARFWRDEPNPPPKRRHHVLKVEAESTAYLCDVGVGGIVPRRPIPLLENVVERQGEESYRLERDCEFGWMLLELKHGEWQRLYSFSEEPQLPKDYLMASYWCENAPESIFTSNVMVAIHTPEGRNTIVGNEFRSFDASGVQTFVPETEAAYTDALRQYFGIVLTL